MEGLNSYQLAFAKNEVKPIRVSFGGVHDPHCDEIIPTMTSLQCKLTCEDSTWYRYGQSPEEAHMNSVVALYKYYQRFYPRDVILAAYPIEHRCDLTSESMYHGLFLWKRSE